MNWEIIGFFGAVCTTFCFIPQIIKTWKTKKVKDFSYIYLIVLTIGIAAWLIYGLSIHDRVVILANLITFIFAFSLLIMKIVYTYKQ